MGVTRQAVLDTIRGWVGMLERTGNNDIWFADDWGITGSSWCDAFYHSGYFYAPTSPNGRLPTENMYVPYDIAWARENGQAIEIDQGGPLPGDGVFFSWDMVNWPRWRAGTGDHIAFVEDWDGADTIWTIEGNVGSPQGVYRKVRSISETVVCFWRPAVFDDSPLGIASLPEEDMDQTQSKQLDRVDHALSDGDRLVNLANQIDYLYRVLSEENRAVAGLTAAQRSTQILERVNHDVYVASTGGSPRNAFDLLDQLLAKVNALGGDETEGEPSAPVVDVEASLKQATPAQLLAALSEVFSAGPKPPVAPPAQADPAA